MKILSDAAALQDYIGKEVGVSDWLEITQERIAAFAHATNDYQWIHIDPERTQRELGHGTIAHGFLTLSLVTFFMDEICKFRNIRNVINYGTNKVRFMKMVPAGARLRGRMTVLKVSQRKDIFYVTQKVTLEIEGEMKPAMIAEMITLLYGAESQAE